MGKDGLGGSYGGPTEETSHNQTNKKVKELELENSKLKEALREKTSPEKLAQEYAEGPMSQSDKDLVKVKITDFDKIRELIRISHLAGQKVTMEAKIQSEREKLKEENEIFMEGYLFILNSLKKENAELKIELEMLKNPLGENK